MKRVDRELMGVVAILATALVFDRAAKLVTGSTQPRLKQIDALQRQIDTLKKEI